MNDIAAASDKGRRTIYTYFRNKRDIYNAVVKTESDKIVEKLTQILDKPEPVEQKLMDFIFVRFECYKDAVLRNGSLRAGFFMDIRKVDRARRNTTAMVMILSLQGLDVPYIRDNFAELGIEKLKLREYLKDFILNGIRNKQQET